jgi:ring-1,2-phenylacetyl-CoA epoxidase subunit PaaD
MQKFGRPSAKSLIESPFLAQVLVTDMQGDLNYEPIYDDDTIWQLLTYVQDPEIPTVSVVDLGIVRSVVIDGKQVILGVTPTYSGCPATELINDLITQTLNFAGYHSIKINQVLSPAWTTDFITQAGREKLKAFGIAPPKGSVNKTSLIDRDIECPHCASTNTHIVSEFGSTACKALYQCDSCREAFDYFKCI